MNPTQIIRSLLLSALLLTEWNSVFAEERWWSLQPLTVQPDAPKAKGGIDSFLLAQLREKNLSFGPEADRLTLIRRLYFDLVGLPPTPEEVEAFLSDARPTAYETVVDRLLASPRYGERWARHWLDVVRFAESDGFETNQPRPNAWPYRDYVIRSFNEDKPYDQFVREQFAGDQLGADEATGFIVGGPWDRVKSPDPALTANQRADELYDMVSATGSSFLGLTVNCARCHNHKFDPIKQSDYYALAACFAGVQHGERELRQPGGAEREEEITRLRNELAPLERALTSLQPLASTARVVLVDDSAPAPKATELRKSHDSVPYQAGQGRGEAGDEGNFDRLPNLGRSYRYWYNTKDADVFAWAPELEGRWRIWLSWGSGWKIHSAGARYVLDLDGKPDTREDQTLIAAVDQRLFADGTGDPPPEKPFWSGFRLGGEFDLTPASRVFLRGDETGQPVTADVLAFEEVRPGLAAASQPRMRGPVNRGENIERFAPVKARFVRFTVEATTQAEPCIDELEAFTAEALPRNVALASAGARASASSEYPNNPIHKIPHVNDGRYGNDWSWISNERGKGWVQVEFKNEETIERVHWSRDRDRVPRYEDRLATRYQVAVSLDGMSWTRVADHGDRAEYQGEGKGPVIQTNLDLSGTAAADAQKLREKCGALRARIGEQTKGSMAYAGRFGGPAKTFLLNRGDPLTPKEEIAPAGLSALQPFSLPMDAPDPLRRKSLGEWITGPAAPLAARVMVNRIWQHHFGTGIVDTPSDFGANGGKPSHPELLDALAGELIRNGWRLKPLHRQMVTCAAYRQEARARPDGLAVDAGNRLLWRMSPRRLEAESLRDTILAVSGKIDLRMGGPGFDLFENNTNYVKVYATKTRFTPEDFRRMVYQNKPRVELDNLFGAFDCPDAGQMAPRRNVSTTPLQALNLLNSAFLLGQAGFFAERLDREVGGDPAARARRAYALAFGRQPDPSEVSAAVELALSHGWPALCRALLNANEFITVY